MFACWRVLITINSYMIEAAIPSSRRHFLPGSTYQEGYEAHWWQAKARVTQA